MFGDLFLEMLAFCGCIILAGVILSIILLITFFLVLFIKGIILVFKNQDDTRK